MKRYLIERTIPKAGAMTGADQARLALLLFVSGAISGFIYWAVAGRDAGLAAPTPVSAVPSRES